MVIITEKKQLKETLGKEIKKIDLQSFTNSLKKLLDEGMGFFDWVQVDLLQGAFLNVFLGGKLSQVNQHGFTIQKANECFNILYCYIEGIVVKQAGITLMLKGKAKIDLNFGKREMLNYFI